MGPFTIILTFSGLTGACLATLALASQAYLRLLLGPGALTVGPALFCFAIAIGAWPVAQLWFKKPRQIWITVSAAQGVLGICAASLPYLFSGSLAVRFSGLLFLPIAIYGVAFGLFFTFLFAASREIPRETSEELGKIGGALLFGVAAGTFLSLLSGFPTLGLRTVLTLAAVVHLALTLVSHYYLRPKTDSLSLPPLAAWRSDQPILLIVAGLCGSALVILLSAVGRYVALATGPSALPQVWLLGLASLSLGAGAFTWKAKRQPISRLGLYLLGGLLLFFAVYLTVGYWPYWHHLVRANFIDVKNDFTAYQELLFAGMAFVFGLPFFIQGRFLPLFFNFFRDDEMTNAPRAGQLLSSFAIGAALAHSLLCFTLPGAYGNDSTFKAALFLLAFAEALALWLAFRGRELKMALASCLLLLTSLAMSPRISPYHFLQPAEVKTPMAEKGRDAFSKLLREYYEYEYYKDGGYASIGIANTTQQGQIFARALFLNGHLVGDSQRDVFPELLLGHLPHLLSHRQRRTALFGVATGQTLGAIATYHAVSQIDVVEPSKELWKERDLLTSGLTDPSLQPPRVVWHAEEAIPFLLKVKEPYDTLIFSATAPLWPGSVNLFTEEFYKLASQSLSEDGLLFQWVPHALVGKDFLEKVLHAAFLAFPEVRVFGLNQGAVGILASKARLGEARFKLARQRMESPPVKNSLLQLDIANLETLLADEVVTPADAFAMAKKERRPWKWDRPLSLNRWEQARFQREHVDFFSERREVSQENTNRDSLLRADLKGTRMRLEAFRELKRVYCLNPQSIHPVLCQEVFILGSVLSPDEKWDPAIKRRYPDAAMAPFKQLLKVPTRFTREQKKQIDEILRVMRQFNGPLVQFPKEEGVRWFEACERTVPKKDTLYGECLFHRLFFEEERGVPKEKLAAQAKAYLDWFKALPLNTENYSTFSSVKNMLVRWAE